MCFLVTWGSVLSPFFLVALVLNLEILFLVVGGHLDSYEISTSGFGFLFLLVSSSWLIYFIVILWSGVL